MARLFHNGHLAISCNNSCHLARGSDGGEDYVTGVGTPVFAPFSGTWRWRVAGTGGWTFTGISSQLAGAVAECMHTSRSNGFVLNGPARFVAEGGLLGWSGGAKGAPGAGSSSGPHMHEHGIWAGVRRGMAAFLSLFTAAAGGGVSPLPDDPANRKDSSMATLYHTRFTPAAPPSPTILAIAAAQGWTIDQGGGTTLALCGDGPLPLFTAPGPFANQLAATHMASNGGSSIELSPGTFNAWVASYWVRPVTLGDVTLPGVLELGPTSLAALAQIEQAVDALNPADR